MYMYNDFPSCPSPLLFRCLFLHPSFSLHTSFALSLSGLSFPVCFSTSFSFVLLFRPDVSLSPTHFLLLSPCSVCHLLYFIPLFSGLSFVFFTCSFPSLFPFDGISLPHFPGNIPCYGKHNLTFCNVIHCSSKAP